ILENDSMTILCDVETLKKLSDQSGLEIKKERKFSEGGLGSSTAKLYEAIVTPNSALDGRTLKEINFSLIYGAWVLAIRNRLGIVGDQVGLTKLYDGNLLVLISPPYELDNLRISGDFLIFSVKKSSEFRYKNIKLAILTLSGVIAVAGFNIAPI